MKFTLLHLLVFLTFFIGCGGGSKDSSSNEAVYPTDTTTYASSTSSFDLTSPSEGSILLTKHTFVVKIGSELDFNVSKVQYWMDNKSVLLGSSTIPPYSLEIDLVQMTNGNHNIQAFAYNVMNESISTERIEIVSYAQSFRDGNEYHVTVNGSPDGDGSINNPWDAQTAFGTYPAGVVVPNPENGDSRHLKTC